MLIWCHLDIPKEPLIIGAISQSVAEHSEGPFHGIGDGFLFGFFVGGGFGFLVIGAAVSDILSVCGEREIERDGDT